MRIAFSAADRPNIKPLLFRAFGLSDLDIMHPGREVGRWSRHRSDLAVLRKRYPRSSRVQRVIVTVKTSMGLV